MKPIYAVVWAIVGLILIPFVLEKRDQWLKKYENADVYPIERRHPTEAEHRTAEQWHWRSQTLISRFTLLFSAIAAGAAAFGYWTLNDTLTQARRQADEAHRQADSAEKSLVVTTRPFISVRAPHNEQDVTPVGVVQRRNGYIVFRYLIENSGNTPGLGVRHLTRMNLLFPSVGVHLPLPSDADVAAYGTQPIISPPHGRHYVMVFSPMPVPDIIWNEIASEGGRRLHIWGTLNYSDSYGNPYFVHFCMWWTGERDNNFADCPGNDGN